MNNNLLASDISCNFEEVYHDGEIQNGLILVSKKKVRYEYFKENLFTIIYNKEWNVLKNISNELIPNRNLNLDLIGKLKKALDQYPDNIEDISNDEYKIKFNPNHNKTFFKDLTISSTRLNLKIHFFDCSNDHISDIYFSHKPFFRYQKL